MAEPDWRAALEAAERDLEADPADRAAGRRRAQATAALGDLAGGNALMEAHLRRHPEDAAGWDLRSAYLLAGGDPEGALAASDRAVALAPAERRHLYNRACALVALGRKGEALADVALAIRGDEDLSAMAWEDPDLAPLKAVEGFRQVVHGGW